MKDIERLLNNVNKLDLNDVLSFVWKQKQVQEYIIRLNTEGEKTSQLYEQGLDSQGMPIRGKSGGRWLEDGEYSVFTKEKKSSEGKRIDHPTLKDSGGFYKSFKVVVTKKGFRVTADFNVGDDNLLDKLDGGIDIEGLTKENILLLLDFIEPMFSKEFEKRLFQ